MELKKHVEEIIVEDGEATGVRLKDGRIARAKVAVVSNATIWDTVPMVGRYNLSSVYPWLESAWFQPLHL
jgi:phytoene dehydrogenase-like protein